MGFRIKIAPGVRVSVGHRGVRTHVGPRIARVHVGSGRTGVSTGIGPLTLYGTVGTSQRRRRSSSAVARGSGGLTTNRSSSTGSAGYSEPGWDRHPTHNTDASQEDWKFARAAEVTQVFEVIDRLLRQSFETPERPVAPSPKIVDEAKIRRRHRAKSLYEGELARAQLQKELSSVWEQLLDNDPCLVLQRLNKAFKDNETRAAAISIDGAVVDLIVLVPQLDSIPLWKPRIGISGRLTCPGLTEIERSSYYDKMVCGHLLNTVRQTLAVAPGISGVTVAVVRFAEPRFCGTSVECLLAADVTRDRLADINWETAFAPEIFCQTSSNLRIRRAPGTQELQLIDLSDEPDILALLEELDQAPGSDASAALRSTATDRDGIRALLEESDQTPDSSDSKGPTSSATPIPLPSGGDAPRAAAVAGEAEQLGLMVGASSGWWKLPR